MTVYTVRTRTGLQPLTSHDDITDAVTAAQTETLAFHVHPDPSVSRRLDLVITADTHPYAAGEPIAWFTAVNPEPRPG